MKRIRKRRDALIRNGRPTRQERLNRVRIKVDSDKTFEEAHQDAVDKVKKRDWITGDEEE